MRRRSVISLLFSLSIVQTAGAQLAPGTIQITVSKGEIAPGQIATLTFTVAGITDPVRIQLRNRTPAVASLEGGDVQIATTSGGSPNTVTRRVMGLTEGPFSLIPTLQPRNDAEIIEAFRSALMRVASQIDRAASELRAEPTGFQGQKTVPLADVLGIIDAAKAELRKSLPYRELTAFHDSVVSRIEEDRRELISSAVAEIGHDEAAIVFVQARPEKRVNESVAKGTLARLANWLRNLSGISPLARVCFRRAPTDHALIAVFPASVPEDRDTTAFVSPLTLYLGKYMYEVSRAGRVTNRGSMDILLNPERVLICPNADGPTCRLIEGRTENCK